MKKRILMVHNYYQIGGGEHTVFENEVRMLRENGHVVITYTRHNDELKTSKWKYILLPFTTIWSFKTYCEIRKIIRSEKIDVVHCHNTFPLISPSVYYAARSLKVPVIQTVHNFRFLCPNGVMYCSGKVCEQCRENNSFIPAIKCKCYRNSRVQTIMVCAMLRFHRIIGTYKKISYIFLTNFNRLKFEHLIGVANKQVFIKPNFVKPMILSDPPTEQMIYFVYAGRLEKNKGIDFLLKAWPFLPKDYHLHIYGDGTCRKDVEKACENQENIHYFGFKPQADILSDLASSDALLFTSRWYEGYPMIIAESILLGKPVVSTNVGNQNNIVLDSGAGVTFSCDDVESFLGAVADVVENKNIYVQRAKEYYQKQLTQENNYRELVKIYEQAKYIT